MNIRIFQINNDRDLHGVKFTDYDFTARYQGSEDIDASIYDEVFAGPVDCNHPEDVYRMFNTEGHPLHRGHSLSVSDVVKIEGDIPPVVGRIRFYNSPTAFEECTYYDEQTWKREIEEARDVGRTIEVDDLRGQGVYDTEQGFYFCDRVGFKKIDFDDTQVHKPDDLMRVVYVEPNKPPYEAEIEPTLRGEQRAVKGLIECVYNKAYLIDRSEAEHNPLVNRILRKDIQFLDTIQVEMATARQFLFIVRTKSRKQEQMFNLANSVEKEITEQGFEVHRMSKEEIKRFLALYFDASYSGEQMPDVDGAQFFNLKGGDTDEP